MKSINKPSTYSYFELLDACKETGCPVCRLGQASAARHLKHLIFDGVNDIPARAVLRESYGYCNEHAWMLPEAGESAPLGIAIIHRDVLNTLRKRLAETEFGGKPQTSFRALFGGKSRRGVEAGDEAGYLPATAVCPACVQRAEAEQLALASLLEALDKEDEAMKAALAASEGLCLAHLRAALAQARKAHTFSSLAAIAGQQLETLIGELDEFVRKSDHRFRDERISAAEADSWRRAVQRVSGSKRR